MEFTKPADGDEDMTQEEKDLLVEAQKIREQIEEARKLVRDTDFVKVTEDIRELGRLKFKIRRHLRGHLAKVNGLHWSVDSQYLLSASQDGKLIVWDTYSGNKLHMIPLTTAWVIGCAYSPNSQYVASGGLDNICSLFFIGERETPDKPSRELVGHDGYISAVKFSDNDKLYSSSGDKTLATWDVEKCKMTQQLLGHQNDVTSFAINDSDKNCLVSVSTDKSARLWDLRKSTAATATSPKLSGCVQIFNGHTQDINGVCYFPNNSYAFLTASDDGTCRMWDIRADQEIATYVDEYIQCGSTCCAISKSGRLLFTGYDDYNCHVWDLLREERVGIMPAHEDRVSAVTVSPDGIAIATAAWDSNCLVWTAK